MNEKIESVLIMYHIEDNDGVVSACICGDAISRNSPDIKIDYKGYGHKSINDIKCKDVDKLSKKYDCIIMTDISIADVTVMKHFADVFGHNFIWLDHHITAMKASVEGGYADCCGLRSTGRSAILQAYTFFFDCLSTEYHRRVEEQKPIDSFPEAYALLSGWDSWSYEKLGYDLPTVRHFNRGWTQTYKLSIEQTLPVVHEINNGNYDAVNVDLIFDVGKSLNDADDAYYDDLCKKHGDSSFKLQNGRTATALFLYGPTNSQMFQVAKTQNGVAFKHNPQNHFWTISLYNVETKDDFHCGQYLKDMYGGGGHQGAAGAQVSEEQFLEILRTKIL